MCQYMLIFGGSVNCIPWAYVPEILPLHARAKRHGNRHIIELVRPARCGYGFLY